MNYSVCPCKLCSRPMSVTEVRESVYWMEYVPVFWYGQTWAEDAEVQFAHRRCWKLLKEKRRTEIRDFCASGGEPRTMGQYA